LKAVVYPDTGSPDPASKAEIMQFVNAGGLLIAGPDWGRVEGSPARETHPRYTLFSAGKGTLAIAKAELTDPYELANDSAILISHRYDILRFWNGGALSAYYASAPNRKTAVVQCLFYANQPTADATVWISGSYRTAKLTTLDDTQSQSVNLMERTGGVEIHLPRVTQYAALELEA